MRQNMTQMPMGGLGSFLTSNMDQIDDNVLAFGRGSGINSMSKIANRMANMGRNGDNELVHVVSPEVLEKNPRLAKELTQSFQNMDENIGDYVVGSEGNSINPMTGQREFFLKGLVKGIKNLFKTVAPALIMSFIPGLSALSPVLKGVIGGGIGGLLQGKGIKGALQGAATGGLLGGLVSGFGGMRKGGPGFFGGVQEGFSGASKAVQDVASQGPTFLDKAAKSVGFDKGFFPSQPTQEAIAAETLRIQGLPGNEALSATMARQAAIDSLKPGFTDYIPAVATATLGAGALGAFDTPDPKVVNPFGTTAKELFEKNPQLYSILYGGFIPPTKTTRDQVLVPTTSFAAKGGEMFPRKTGFISGPGTETSDDVPAMLSDGEFVMTARAVRGLGNGSRKQGVRKMYDMMKNFERSVPA